jgi:hypothetical protein
MRQKSQSIQDKNGKGTTLLLLFFILKSPRRIWNWLSEWLLVLLNAKWAILQLYHGEKKQTTGKYVVSLGHFILIPGQPVFVLSPEYCVLSCEATYTNFIIFGLIRLELEPTVDLPQDGHDNNYATNAVEFY